MWTFLSFLTLWSSWCTVSSSPPCPINATFTSVNLRNVLQWFPGNGTPEDTRFTVQYAIYGDSVANAKGTQVHWRKVQRCTKIMQTWCDLSNDMRDLEQGYYARVRAVSRRSSSIWTLTRRFDPKSDTSFGPPLVSIEIENNSAIITLKGPMRYPPNNHTSVESMATLYPQMMYNLSIHNTHRNIKNHVTLTSGLFKYRLMDYNTEYCFSAKAKFLAMPVQCHSSEWHCITTPPDPVNGQLQRVVLSIAVPSLCLFMLVMTCYLLHHYLMGKGQKSPYTLNPPSFNHTNLTFPLEKLNIIHVTGIEPIFHRQYMADPPPGYPSQSSGSASDLEQPHDGSSLDYGFVAVASKIDVGGDEETERRADGTNHEGEHQKNKSTTKSEDHLSRVNRCQAKTHLSQSSTPTCLQKHKPADIGSSMHAKPLAQTLGATNREADTEEGDKGFLGSLIINKTPQTGFLHVTLNLQTTTVDVKIGGSVGEGSERECVPLLSTYASQDITAISNTDKSDYLADKYCFPRPAVRKEDPVEEEEGGIFLDWEPSAWNPVLPDMAAAFGKEKGLDWLLQDQKEREQSLGSEEEVNLTKGRVMLQDVLVRQTSEEEAEAQRELERDGEREWDNILSKWNLVIPMDE